VLEQTVGAIAESRFFYENPDRINRILQDGQDKSKYTNKFHTFILRISMPEIPRPLKAYPIVFLGKCFIFKVHFVYPETSSALVPTSLYLPLPWGRVNPVFV